MGPLDEFPGLTESIAKNHKYKSMYMEIAQAVSKMSYAKRLQVGCVIVKDGRIISMGWNGMPKGFENDCENLISEPFAPETEHLVTKDEVLHAESNAIAKLAKCNDSGNQAHIYCTHAPCIECAKLIHQSGIERLTYKDQYKNSLGLYFLEKAGVHIDQWQ